MTNCELLRTTTLLLLAGALASAQTKPALDFNYGNIPLSFEANQGQIDPQVRFLSRGQGYSLFLTDTEAVLSLQQKGKRADAMRMQFLGTNQKPHVTGLGQLPGKSNYFIGSDPNKWRSNLPTYERVSYKSVYPGVDLVYYGNQKQLEYDLVIAPGADTKQLKLHFTGARRLRLDREGNLIVFGDSGNLAFRRPLVYQQKERLRIPVQGAFRLAQNETVQFSVGAYDHSRELVIDPTLVYSTYLGGSTTDDTTGIAADSFGETYLTGYTTSANFPTTPGSAEPVGSTAVGYANAFITKVNAQGTGIVYSTFIGGTRYTGSTCFGGIYGGVDASFGIAIDPAGNAYVAGCTGSFDFPVTKGAYQTSLVEKSGFNDAFVTKLSQDGSTLLYSTYLGFGGDSASAIAVDVNGFAYVAGNTASKLFPVTPGAFQTVNHGSNGFVTKLNQSGSGIVYATYLGGASASIKDIAIDLLGSAYVVGNTVRNDFPTTAGAFQVTNKEKTATGTTGFVTKFTPDGSQQIFSTYLGGSGGDGVNDYANGIAVDVSGYAYVTGSAGSPDFPSTSGSYQVKNRTIATYGQNAFVTKFNLFGTNLVYSTFLGGSNSDSASRIAVDPAGNVYLTGTLSSNDFPVTYDAFQKTIKNTNEASEVFLSEIDSTGSNLVYSTMMGGTFVSEGSSVALDGAGNVFITGHTSCSDFPVTPGVLQTTNKANINGTAFVARFSLTPPLATTVGLTADTNPQLIAKKVTFTAVVTSTSGIDVPTGNLIFSVDGKPAGTVALDSLGHATFATSTLRAGSHLIAAAYQGDTNDAPGSAILTEVIGNISQIKFGTSPSGLSYSVDGVTYAGPTTLPLVIGSQHTIAVTSPQMSNGGQNSFLNWSDGGALSHNITIAALANYSANFSTSYPLSTFASPYLAGIVTGSNPNSYYPVGTSVAVTAISFPGYAFQAWLGNVANQFDASTTVTIDNANPVTAYFIPIGVGTLFGNIIGKSGPTGARVWNIQVSNNGPGTAPASNIATLSFVQTGGVACSPIVTSALPLSVGDLAPGASVIVPVTLNFTGCAANSRFTVTVSVLANGSSGSIYRLNQFQ